MKISVEKPYSINEIGKRLNNEDFTLPLNEEVSTDHKLYLVCDGVGGANKGEAASAIACESIQTYFNTFMDPEKEIDAEFIEKSIRYTEIRFDEYIKNNPSAKGMATTLCLLYISDSGIFLAHAGDSRIYQFRNGNIIFKTEDHSLVNALLKNGKINPEEAQTHPQKNIILRAIQGTSHPVDTDIVKLDDIQPGDQFFLCTDGIFEVMNDTLISQILSKEDNAQNKMNEIRDLCNGKTRDNFSAYLIPIHDVQQTRTFNQIFATFLSAFM